MTALENKRKPGRKLDHVFEKWRQRVCCMAVWGRLMLNAKHFVHMLSEWNCFFKITISLKSREKAWTQPKTRRSETDNERYF